MSNVLYMVDYCRRREDEAFEESQRITEQAERFIAQGLPSFARTLQPDITNLGTVAMYYHLKRKNLTRNG